MRKFCGWVLVVSLLHLPMLALAQADTTTPFAGFGYTLELPAAWSAQSASFLELGAEEITVFMPSAVPTFPENTLSEFNSLTSFWANIGAVISSDLWLTELTTQPTFVAYSINYGGTETFITTEAIVEDMMSGNALGFETASFGTPTPREINGLAGISVMGDIPGAQNLAGHHFKFNAAAFAQPGQLIFLIGFAPDTLFDEHIETLEGILQSFQFAAAPALELTIPADAQLYENDRFSLSYPADWIHQVEHDAGEVFTNAAVTAGLTSEAVDSLIYVEPTNGEAIIMASLLTPNDSLLDGLNVITPEIILTRLLPAADVRAFAYHQIGDKRILVAHANTGLAYEMGVYITQIGDDYAAIYTFTPTTTPLDPTIPLTMLTTLTPR